MMIYLCPQVHDCVRKIGYVTEMLLTFHSHPQYNSLKTSMDHNSRVEFYIPSSFILDGSLLLPGVDQQ